MSRFSACSVQNLTVSWRFGSFCFCFSAVRRAAGVFLSLKNTFSSCEACCRRPFLSQQCRRRSFYCPKYVFRPSGVPQAFFVSCKKTVLKYFPMPRVILIRKSKVWVLLFFIHNERNMSSETMSKFVASCRASGTMQQIYSKKVRLWHAAWRPKRILGGEKNKAPAARLTAEKATQKYPNLHETVKLWTLRAENRFPGVKKWWRIRFLTSRRPEIAKSEGLRKIFSFCFPLFKKKSFES